MDKQLISDAFASGADVDKIQAAIDAENMDALRNLIIAALAPPPIAVNINLPGVDANLLQTIQDFVNKRMNEMGAALDRLKAEVAEQKSVNAGVVTLVQGLRDQLRDFAANGASADDLNAVADELDAETAKLAQAVQAQTVADPAAPPADNSIDAAPNTEPSVPPVADIVEPAPVDPAANV